MSTGQAEARLPLSGIRVLELGHYISAPHCGQLLADHGAEVIKIEPLQGEAGRSSGPFARSGTSLYFAAQNTGKRSVSIDLKRAEGQALLGRLMETAQILVTNYGVEVPERLGFSADSFFARQRKGVYVHITGFGRVGEWRATPAFDGLIQAVSGMASLTGSENGAPQVSNVTIVDHASGVQAALAAIIALRGVERDGVPVLVDVSMLKVAHSFLGHYLADFHYRGAVEVRSSGRTKNRFTGVGSTLDGWVYVAPYTERMWVKFCTVIGLSGPISVPTETLDEKQHEGVQVAFDKFIETRTSEEVVDILRQEGVVVGRYLSVDAAVGGSLSAPPASARKSLVDGQVIKLPPQSFGWSGADMAAKAVPQVGEHSLEVLEELGLSSAQRYELWNDGVIGSV